MPRRDPTKPKKNPFAKGYAPYGTYEGETGNPQQWKAAYEQRMGAQEAAAVMAGSGETTYSILGIKPGASWAEIKSAYRSLVFKVHPDHGGSQEAFVRVNAAYSILAAEFKS